MKFSFGELMNGLMNALQLVIITATTLALLQLQNWLKKRKADVEKELHSSGELGARIRIVLAELGTMLKAERCYLCQYHNGEHYVSGSSVLKNSRSHEWTQASVRGAARQHQNIPISLVHDEGDLVEEAGPSFRYTEDLPQGTFRRILEAEEVKAIARCAVRKDKGIIGFVGVDFLDRPSEKPDLVKLLPNFAARIEQLLAEKSEHE